MIVLPPSRNNPEFSELRSTLKYLSLKFWPGIPSVSPLGQSGGGAGLHQATRDKVIHRLVIDRCQPLRYLHKSMIRRNINMCRDKYFSVRGLLFRFGINMFRFDTILFWFVNLIQSNFLEHGQSLGLALESPSD